ncbi:MAG TPA: sulfotransferase [Gammaproteobacteria bacterium]|nr:sulfotransferase [Gammaproteobacteria bacterium]
MSYLELVTDRPGPVLVIGMHRSGTRLLADVLGRLGIFMGADRQADAESVTFLQLNEAILHQCGAFWSEPMPAHFVLAEPATTKQLAAGVARALDQRIQGYLGSSGSESSLGTGTAQRCGWKDPRNTFTLPVWRELYPNLKVVHMLRHGVDVAASLARRHAEALRLATGETVPGALTVIRDDALGVLSSRRGWSLSEALTMWEQYAEKARLQAAELGDGALEIRFEQLLEQPDRVIRDIADFCAVPDTIGDAAFLEGLDAGRAFAYRNNAELVEFAESQRAVLERYGYAP